MQKINRERFHNDERIVREHGKEVDCPIWLENFPAKCIQTTNLTAPRRYWSPRAGGLFTIPASIPVGRIQLPDHETRKRVSSWIWERNIAFDALGEGEDAEPPELTSTAIRELAGRPQLSIEQRIDRALRAIGRPPRRLLASPPPDSGERQYNESQLLFLAASECEWGGKEMNWLLKELESTGLATNVRQTDPSTIPAYSLTLKGLNRLETGGMALVSNTAFVAMWFHDKVSDAYNKGIEPAIREAGYEPMRIDRIPHSGKIDDRIIAEIRRARFMVCDLTSGLVDDRDAVTGKTEVARGSVYYEAGFAQGLGKPVIWTCRKDFLDHNRIHFDVRQYACIPWEEGKEEDLREALYERIRAEIT